jgi:rod shape-determining protein MreD
VVVASLLGYATDLFSGALLGQHALLRALTFAVTRLANRRLDLRQPIPLACLVAALTVLDAAGVMALTRLFAGRVAIDGDLLLLLGAQVLVNAVAAPMMSASMRGLLDWTAHDEGLRRTVRLAPRPPIP